jgi:hypothetical protein
VAVFLKFKDYAAGMPIFKKNDPVRAVRPYRSQHLRIGWACASRTL